METYPRVEKCLKCSLCGPVCIVKYVECFSPTYTYVYDVFSAKEPIKNPSIWWCVACHKCQEICPYDVKPLEAILGLREAALENGFGTQPFVDLVESVLSTGVSFPITSFSTSLRAKLNLPPLEIVSVEDVKKIAEKTSLGKKLEKIRLKELEAK